MKTIIILAGIIIILFALATGRGLSHLTQKLPKKMQKAVEYILDIILIIGIISTICFIFF